MLFCLDALWSIYFSFASNIMIWMGGESRDLAKRKEKDINIENREKVVFFRGVEYGSGHILFILLEGLRFYQVSITLHNLDPYYVNSGICCLSL